ncbi:MAG: DUF5916 domain-containing protein [Candidatus Aminicenantales bacterium]
MRYKKSAWCRAFVCLAFLGSAAAGAGAAVPAQKSIVASPAGGAIKIDGVLSEPVWQGEGAGGFTQTDPFDGQPETERTTVWIAYDPDFLYVAARLTDGSPNLIVSRLGRRDDIVDSDWFYFSIDPYYDKRSGYFFAVNPAGGILDGTLFNDESSDATWDGIWESAARIDDKGWAVEIRIPFAQLRFKRRDVYVWGVNFERLIKRKNETDHFAWRPKEESGYVSRFAELTGVRGIDPGRRLEFLPYAAGRSVFEPAVRGNPFRTGSAVSGNVGFDFKAGLKSNLTLDLSVNPDFGQVEVDPAVINISDQETYYTEKRPFFIEGSSIFDFGRGGPNVYKAYGWSDPAFFYSRRIGRAPQGSYRGAGFSESPDFASILAAAKVTGKIGKGFDLGVIGALTSREYAEVDIDGARSESLIEPFTSYGVVRGLKEFSEGRSGVGFIGTSVVRDLSEGNLASLLVREAFALAADGWTFFDKEKVWSLSGWAGTTLVRGSTAAITRLERSALHYFQRPDADWVRLDADATSLSGWAGRLFLNKQKGNFIFNAALGAMSPGFESNDLGYHSRGDIVNGHVQAGYQSFHPGPVFRTWNVKVSYFRNYDFGGNRIGEYLYLNGAGKFLNYWTATVQLDYEPPKYSHYLTRGGPMAYYPSGATVTGDIETDDRKSLIVAFSSYYRYHPSGGYNWAIGGGLTWKPSPNFSLSVWPSYSFRYSQGQWVTSFVDPLKTETNGIRYIMSDIIQKTVPVEVRLDWSFTPRLSLQAYLQPYYAVGDYRDYKDFAKAMTFDFNFYGQNGSTIAYADGFYTADPDGDGPIQAFTFADPDFNLKSFRGTVVLRWEYRPGSMFYFVWTQARADYAYPGDFDFWRDFGDVFRAPGENIFLLKFSYRFEL